MALSLKNPWVRTGVVALGLTVSACSTTSGGRPSTEGLSLDQIRGKCVTLQNDFESTHRRVKSRLEEYRIQDRRQVSGKPVTGIADMYNETYAFAEDGIRKMREINLDLSDYQRAATSWGTRLSECEIRPVQQYRIGAGGAPLVPRR